MSAVDADLASHDEVIEALQRLTDADLLRIESFARYRAYGLAWVDWQDLVQEAISRTLRGGRRWPKSVPFVTFIRESIRSIAHEELRHRAEGPIRVYGDLSVAKPGDLPDAVLNAPDPAPGPEQQVGASQALDEILRAFAGDGAALAVVRGMAEGSSPEEVCRQAGITLIEYQSTRKRIRRRLMKVRANVGEGTLQ